jgi:hypothetical protein
MARIKKETANEDGWTDWIHTLPGYRMVCCDCGLSHNMEMEIYEGKPYFRMSRNERSTAQVRRHDAKKVEVLKPVSKKARITQSQADAAVRDYIKTHPPKAANP